MQKSFKFNMIRYRGSWVIAEKPRVRHLGRIFRAPCRKNYAVDQKIDCSLFWWSWRVPSPCKVWELSDNACGCSWENIVFVYRQDCAKRKLPVLNLLAGQKQGFRPAATRCTDTPQTWHFFQGARGSAWLRKISPQSVQAVGNSATKYEKFPIFGKESHRMGEPFDRFLELLWAFIGLTVSISIWNLAWFASQVTEVLMRNRASVI